MDELLRTLPVNRDPNLLVGYENSDDAGVYRLTDDLALVTTADIITPPVNDPFRYGQIAAANAIGDVYAMGGRPLTCLNLVCFPPTQLEPQVLHRIVAGALDKITEAGAVLAGGHTVEDDEPKFGLAVTGIVHPAKFWANSGARPGDVLILTKPLGSGVIFNANIKKWVSSQALEACLETAAALNRTSAETMSGFGVHGATDVTGFGLAGHGYEMAQGSGVCLEIRIDDLPLMDEAIEMYRRGVSTGVNVHNRRLTEARTRFESDLPAWHREIVFDPQTSGGLLLSVDRTEAEAALTALHRAGVKEARIIGTVRPQQGDTRLLFR